MDSPRDDEDRSRGLGVSPLIGIAALVLVVGLGIGGAFAIGLQIGRGQAEGVEEPPPLAITAEQPATEEICARVSLLRMRRGERFRPLLCNAYAQRELQRRTLLQFAPNLDNSRVVNRDFLRAAPGSRRAQVTRMPRGLGRG